MRLLLSRWIALTVGLLLIGIAACNPSPPSQPPSPEGEATHPSAPETALASTTTSTHVTPTLPPTIESTATQTPLPDNLTPEVRLEVETIESQVIQIRGLMPSGPLGRSLLTSDQLRQRIIDDLLKDYSPDDARKDALLLTLLGLMDTEVDFWSLQRDLLIEQVAGYYDPDSSEMFIVQVAEFGGPEHLTYSHEFAHALQDQNFDFQTSLGFTYEACEEDGERCAAVESLLEGDASLVEEQWLETSATSDDLREIVAFYTTLESPVYLSSPAFLRKDLLFPYVHGLEFVRSLYEKGGWAAVNAAYLQPPLSTEQILHPERYPEDPPKRLAVPDLAPELGPGWEEIDRDVLGEWFTRIVLEEQVSSSAAAKAAEGWGGDYLTAFYNQEVDAGLLVVVTAWDTSDEAKEFFNVFLRYGDMRFGGRRYTGSGFIWRGAKGISYLERRGDQTLWIVAPSGRLIDTVLGSLPFPAESK